MRIVVYVVLCFPVVCRRTCLIYVICVCAYSFLLLFVGARMSYLRYLCLHAYSGVQHMLCCVFLLFVGGRMLRYLCLASGVQHMLCCVFRMS